MTSTRENENVNGMEGVRFGRCRIKPGPHGNASVAFCLYEKCMKGPNEMIAVDLWWLIYYSVIYCS